MNIDLLSQMVYDLILENDRVSLPGMGVFVAEMVPATFTDRGYTINPPYRRLSFRSGGQQDNLLAELYAASNNVTAEVAQKVLVEFVSEMKAVLFVKKTVVFPGLGRLRATRENNIFFVADEALDIFPEGFALEPLSLKARRESAAEINRSVEKLGEILKGADEAVDEASGDIGAVRPVGNVGTEDQPEPSMPETSVPEPSMPETSMPGPSGPEPVGVSKSRKVWRGIGIAVAVAAALAAVAIGGFILLARLAPSFVDSLLYTPEQLQIINWKL
ncbi:MAG: hypothetical protein ACI39U_04655 [Candidatus Cryptobacteroides sp.]